MQASKRLLRNKKAKSTIPHSCLGMGWGHLHNCGHVLGPNETWWEVPHVVSVQGATVCPVFTSVVQKASQALFSTHMSQCRAILLIKLSSLRHGASRTFGSIWGQFWLLWCS